MNIFLKTKAWYLIAILFAPLILTELISLPFLIAASISLLIFFGWVWSISVYLNKKLPPEIRAKTRNLGYVLCLICVFYIFGALSFTPKMYSDYAGELRIYLSFSVQVILALLYLYIIKFITRSLVAVEKNRNLEFGDYAFEFWETLIIPPRGIWVIQSRVYKLFREDRKMET